MLFPPHAAVLLAVVVVAAGQQGRSDQCSQSIRTGGRWECTCLNGKGQPMGGAACGGGDECSEQPCGGQLCHDPNSSVLGDYTCTCPRGGGSATGGLATCPTTDECLSNPCGDGQSCSDPSHSTWRDFVCQCHSSIVSARGKSAACGVLDECSFLNPCRAGQQCNDPVPTPESRGDYECRCPEGGSKVGGPANCGQPSVEAAGKMGQVKLSQSVGKVNWAKLRRILVEAANAGGGAAAVAVSLTYACPGSACPDDSCPVTHKEMALRGCMTVGGQHRQLRALAEGDRSFALFDIFVDTTQGGYTALRNTAFANLLAQVVANKGGSSSILANSSVLDAWLVSALTEHDPPVSPAPSPPNAEFPWWWVIVAVILFLLLVILFIFLWKRRRARAGQPDKRRASDVSDLYQIDHSSTVSSTRSKRKGKEDEDLPSPRPVPYPHFLKMTPSAYTVGNPQKGVEDGHPQFQAGYMDGYQAGQHETHGLHLSPVNYPLPPPPPVVTLNQSPFERTFADRAAAPSPTVHFHHG